MNKKYHRLEDELMPTSIIYSGHSTELSLTFTTMGLFQDDVPLMHDNYADQQDRQFKTTKELPFAGNMEFILYLCDEGVTST